MMTKFKALAIGVGVAMLLPALASAVVLEGHFSGHADHAGPAPGVYSDVLPYTAYATLNTTQTNPWYPWNQALYEYTVVIDAVIDNYTGVWPWVYDPNPFIETTDFNVAAVSIYEDSTTPADFGNLSTFTDGTLILSGVIQNMIGEHLVMWASPLAPDPIAMPWTITGVVVMTGGAGLGDLDGQCSGGLVMNDFVDFIYAANPAGFEEAYDVEWKCPEPSTAVEDVPWGRLKSLYR